jgi:diaminopimelate decarboxylase
LLTFNIESSEELDALSRVAARLKIRAPISIRLNPDVNAGTHPHITTGRAENKFGVDTNEAMALYKRAVVDPWLHVKGIQCHIGSQITTVGPYRRAAQSVAKVIKRLEAMGIRLSQVDMGGGIGIQYKNEKTVSLPTLAEEIIKTFSPWPDLRLMLEPGRYLVAEAGLLLTRVIYRKKTSKRMFIIVDGAMTDLPRPALYDAWHPIEPVRPRRGAKALVDVVGPVCESADFLARGRKLPPLERGDVLAVGKAGAYGFAMSSQYNSRPRAAEILIDKGETRLVRQRETMEDLIQGEA